jgi:16S rRNA (cytosine1402-N4)-methyltransferase
VPVLVTEVLEALRPRPGDLAVDATLGWGGHAAELLCSVLPGGRLLALDVDPIELPKAAARLAQLAADLGDPGAFKAVRRNFAGLRKVLEEEGWTGADVLLADLGVSSMQLDDPARGFSWKHDGPLDLRMNPRRGLPAGELLLKMKKEEIGDLLRRYSDEPQARQIAEALHRASARDTHLLGTSDVARAVELAYEGRTDRHASEAKFSSLQRTFQALRILVNDELTALDAFLRDLPACLAPGGRAAILTFHSGEDRRVKKVLKEGLVSGVFTRISESVVRASPEELRRNPRSSPAKLRWAVRAH